MSKQSTKNNTNVHHGMMVLMGGKWVPVEELHKAGKA